MIMMMLKKRRRRRKYEVMRVRTKDIRSSSNYTRYQIFLGNVFSYINYMAKYLPLIMRLVWSCI
jgi:hypothetical protein